MAKPKNLKFKPYVGNFFRFVNKVHEEPSCAIVGTVLYGNSIKNRIKFELSNDVPSCVLVVEEKRNNVKFIDSDSNFFWTTKAQIEPFPFPPIEDSLEEILKEYKDFLVYCTDTKVSDFSIEKMTKIALTLLPKINSLIQQSG